MGIFFLATAGCMPLTLPPPESLPPAPTETFENLMGLPADPIFHRSLHAGEQAFNRGNYAAAEHYYSLALKRARETSKKENPMAESHIAWAASYLFDAYLRQEKWGEAEQVFRQSRETIMKASPKKWDYVKKYTTLLRRMGREAEAAEIEAPADPNREERKKGDKSN